MDAEKVYDYLAVTAQAELAQIFLKDKEPELSHDAEERRKTAKAECLIAESDYDTAINELEEDAQALEEFRECIDEAKLARAKGLLAKKRELEERMKVKMGTLSTPHPQLVEKQKRVALLKQKLAAKKALQEKEKGAVA